MHQHGALLHLHRSAVTTRLQPRHCVLCSIQTASTMHHDTLCKRR